MMLGSGHLISGLDVATGTFVLVIFSAGAALAVLIVLACFTLRRAGRTAVAGALLVCGLALVGGVFGYALFDHFAVREQATERRAIEARAAELTARSLAPGSALGCLDAVASLVVENACERPLFASPEAVAAAVAYVDARFSQLTASAALAERDPTYQPAFERLRRGLEADRYGVVAHVLMTRGCSGADCAELRLLRDPTRVLANMKARAFESYLGVHALAWQPNGAGQALASAPPFAVPPPQATNGAGPGAPITEGSRAVSPPKFDFPSASSIPPVSIMSSEPGTPPAADSRSPAAPPRRAAVPPTSRRQSSRETAAPQSAPTPSTPPTPIAPEAVEMELIPSVAPTGPDPHTTR
ncbi:MAG: hypothetical protein QOF09_1222 [Alphaproteobacteria bacterium]|jgi:hypothetical protein|nr:hypothetical protein [Alphaproteobacteria bacterium]